MKKVILLVAISSLLSTLLVAQVTPEGMNYQAVARNLKAEILANQPISLKVSLFSIQSSGKVEYYNEVHNVTTSLSGVFSLIIGSGTPGAGLYHTVPWSSQNIWMEVAIKSKGDVAYLVTSSSKLLAVPYAYHALTAERFASGNTNSTTNTTNTSNASGTSTPSQSWLLFGNSSSNPTNDKLGTTDSVDLKMVTNNQERLRIYANGDIVIRKNLRINANLTLDSSAFLNITGGSTINYGPFTVDRQSPALLSGILTVDGATDLNSSLNVDGATDLNSRLNVNNASPTLLTGTLQVKGITDLDSALNVNNISPTLLTGTLQVDKNAVFKERLKIESGYQTDTSGANPASGALQVNGGAFIGKNLYVGGIAKFGGPAAFGGAVTISDLTQSTSITTGALKIAGGVGIGKRLNVGEAVGFSSTLNVDGISSFLNTTESTSAANGALIVSGGAGIARNLNIGGNLTTTGITTLNNTLTVNGSGSYIANFVNSANSNGISIKIGNDLPNNSNNFISFLNQSGATVGRIEGERSSEFTNNLNYTREIAHLDAAIQSNIISVATASIAAAIAAAELVAALSSSTPCAGLGVCVTAPIISLSVKAGASLIVRLANVAATAIGLTMAQQNKSTFISQQATNQGLTFQSGSGDYAEWLPKENAGDTYLPGYIVGIRNGHISKNLQGASKLFVISTKPIVLGNMPAGGEAGYEKVAFLGQVPVHVLGKVNMGDYILPSGKNDGMGIGRAPGNMKAGDYANIVGVAWSASDNDIYSVINLAIGLNTGDVSKVVAEQAKEIEGLKSQISETNNILAKLVPGFAAAAGVKEAQPSTQASTVPAITPNGKIDYTESNSSNIVYFDITEGQMKAMFDMAEKMFVEGGGVIEKNAFWKQIKTSPGAKETMIQEIRSKLKAGIDTQKEIIKNRVDHK